MLKKLSLLLLLLPTAASAWQLTTRVNTTGGSLRVGSGPLQSYGNAVLKTYTTHQNVPVTLTADSGNKILKVQIGGTYVTPLPTDNPQVYQMGLVQYPTTLSQSIGVWFTKQLTPVTAMAGLGGTVSPTGTLNLQYSTPATYTFTPGAGNRVIAISGLPAGATLQDAVTSAFIPNLPGAINQAVKATFVVPASPVTMTAIFLGVTANVGAADVTFPGRTVTLDASGSVNNAGVGSLTYVWAQTGGAAVTLSDPLAVKPTFVSTNLGLYSFKVTVSNGTSSDTANKNVTVTTSAVEAARSQCQQCHQPQNIGASANVFPGWSSSKHAHPTQGSANMCYGCHIGSDTGGHPGLLLSGMGNICRNCHTDSSGNVANHPVQIGTMTCTSCHDPHNTTATRVSGSLPPPHVNTVTTGMYPASYVTSRSSCPDCHGSLASANNPVIRGEWKNSGHANTQGLPWIAQDFKTLSGCVQCHTTTGFLAYSTGKVTAAWGTASDLTKEVLTCRGCHKQDFSIRVLSPYSSSNPYTISKDSTTVSAPPGRSGDYGISNICVPCHSGTTGGVLIKEAFTNAAFTNFTAVGRFLNHYKVGAGIMDNTLGYEFEGTPRSNFQDYNKQNTWHSGLSLVGSRINTGQYGPCVTCHLSAAGHSYTAVFKNTTGNIVNVVSQAKCDQCHPSQYGGGDQMTAGTLNSRKGEFSDALAALKAQLKASGLDPDSSGAKSWGSTLQLRSNNMGAYYNYFLLHNSDTGAYIHNPTYAKRLIQYSIDWLDDNALNDSAYDTIYALNSQSRISAAVRDSAIAYLGLGTDGTEVNCFLCHKDYYQ